MDYFKLIGVFVLVIVSYTLLAGGVGPPPNPIGVPLDGGFSIVLIASGAYIGYKALKNNEEE